MKNEQIINIIKTYEFFKKRFPNKILNMRLEIECGYFGEWMDRIHSGHPEYYMDSDSLKVWNELNEVK